ncbi:MAG: hypothetical protein U1C33_06190, partial [Candidatus Cloacimonadaceae bacterium]|nr:hypothetical protein [Candidatus Cloacimonadaceae bacterium]
MRPKLLNEKGNLAIALVLAVVGIMSGFTMTTLAMRDVVGFQYDYDAIQALHLVRAESLRGQAVIQQQGLAGSEVFLTPRTVEVKSSNLTRTLKIRSKATRDEIFMHEGGFRTGGYTIKTLVTPARGRGRIIIGNKNDSIVRKYGEYTLRSRSFSEFHYFTDNEESTNGTAVYFWGPDEISGRVHSNTDIWIKMAGGGNNGGWPLFHNLVTTAGEIKTTSGLIPYEQVFPGGYFENYHTYEYPPVANNIRNNGDTIGDENDPNLIYFVTVSGASYSVKLGTITPRRDSVSVYVSYPPIPGTPLFRNNFASADTIWS